MQTVQSFMARRNGAGTGDDMAGGNGLSTLDTGASTSITAPGPDTTGLRAARAGTSAVSAFSNFAMSFRTAAAYDAQARAEELASRVEYTQAQEKSNAIGRAYQSTIGSQVATAVGNGLDIASGTVQAAGRDAQTEADRQLTIIRNNANMNAKLRLARSAAYRSASANSKLTGFLGLFSDIGSIAVKAATGGVG